jgi:hypothetical protein
MTSKAPATPSQAGRASPQDARYRSLRYPTAYGFATTAPKPGAGKTFSSGLTVPSVSLGSAAKDIRRELREKAESTSGAKQAALRQLEAQMPETLAKLEAGLAKRDFGVAVAYFFVTTYETATSTTVPSDASLAAGRTIAEDRYERLQG